MDCISVIIPAFQAESFLARCVDGVLLQTWQNIEVILVDDGSTDATPGICDAYQRKDHRVRVIHQMNGGLSAARNAGLSLATGEYVLFLDADDFWDDDNALLRLIERVHKTSPDVLNFSYKKFFESTEIKEPYFVDLPAMPENLSTKEEQVNYLTDQGLYIASACNKLIRRKLISTPNMRFEEGVFSEDITWCLRLLLKAQSQDFICENFYCYRQREGSITHTIDDKKCEDLCNNILQCEELIQTADPSSRKAAELYTAYQLGTFFKNQALAEHPQRECIQKLKGSKGLLKNHGGSRKLQLLNASCNVIGFAGTCKLARLLYAPKRAGGRA